MSSSISVSANPFNAVEGLSFATFQNELRHVARFITAAAPANPLEAVLAAIRRNPALSQARLLTRILGAYIGREVSFRSAEVAAFDREHLGLLVALMNTHEAGTLPSAEWERAANEADAAQRDIGG
jgi:thioesterase domain-containing protein